MTNEGATVDEGPLSTTIGALSLKSCVMTASGTAGMGAELGAYGDLGALGAVVTKSISLEPWAGNGAPRVAEVQSGMLNSVGLQGPGVDAWLSGPFIELRGTGATVVASIWGRTVEEYRLVARRLAGASLAAIEVNVSCPNLDHDAEMFAHSPEATAAVVDAVTSEVGPTAVWVKLSPNTPALVAIARAAIEAGASSLTLTNTLVGMALDRTTGRPILANRTGGLSGPAIHAVSLRAVYEVTAALGPVPIVGAGGVTSGETALDFLFAGASAVQVGTATFFDPRAPWFIAAELSTLLINRGVCRLADVIGLAHRD